MQIRVRNQQDFVAGLFFLVIALGALAIGWGYPTGTAVRMSAGYFPRLLCGLLALLAVIVLVGAVRVEGPNLKPVKWRPLLMVPAAVVAFGLGIQYLGFALAAVLITIFGSFASPRVRWGEMLIASVALTFLAIGIFIWGVGLPIPIWPEF